jgi:hypothetical protein
MVAIVLCSLTTKPWEWQYDKHIQLLPTEKPKSIPRKIWAFWDKATLPDKVRKCIDTWYVHCPDYEITILCPETLHEYLEEDLLTLPYSNTPQRLSDFVRLHILDKFGGFWVDASTIMFQNLDYYHHKQQLSPHTTELVGYYLATKTSRSEYPLIENWFFGCVQGSRFVRQWKTEFMRINQFSSALSYVANVRLCGIDIQMLAFPNYYLSMHVAAQSVLQRHRGVMELLLLERAEDGPFKYLVPHQWKRRPALQFLCENRFTNACPILKITGDGRDCVDAQDIDRIIENGT